MKQIVNIPGISNINQEFEFDKLYVAYKDNQYLFCVLSNKFNMLDNEFISARYAFSNGQRKGEATIRGDITLYGSDVDRSLALKQLITKTLGMGYKVYSFDNITEFVDSIRNGNF